MRSLVLFLVAALASLQEGHAYEGWAICYAGDNFMGTHHTFHEANPHLGSYGFDNTIESVRVHGVWLFYDHEQYNTNHPDPTAMYWVYGINGYGLTIPAEYQNIATSLRPAGCVGINDECWNIYEGLYFAARTFSGTAEMQDLSFLDFDVSSIIITGNSAWTFCDQLYYGGTCVCLYPSTDHLREKHTYDHLDVGIYPTMAELQGILHVMSIRKGCYGKQVADSPRLMLNQHTKGGFGGRL